MSFFRKLFFIFIIFSFSMNLFSKTNSDERRFQLGIGFLMSTSNLFALIEDVRMAQDLEAGRSYNAPNLTESQKDAITNLPSNMRRGIYVSNILASMEYGIKTRLLWQLLMVESDLIFLPYDSSYNGRMDLEWTADIGVRCPWFIMPYFLAGMNFTFSWYPTDVKYIDDWKTKYGYSGIFVWRPGINIKTGLDFKWRSFSIGVYYQYTIKDFEEFTGFWSVLYNSLDNGIIDQNSARSQAAWYVFAAQSRFGISMIWYIF
jgi:hypothetical protein